MEFYHGSKSADIKELVTSHSKDGYVYATSSRLVALTYAARVYPNLFFSMNGKEYFWELKPNLLEKMTKNKSAYIYLLQDKDFEPIPQSNRCGHQNCYRVQEDVKTIKKEFIADAYEGLLKYAEKGEFQIIRENDIPIEKKKSMISEIAECAKSLSEEELSNKNNFWKMFLEDS